MPSYSRFATSDAATVTSGLGALWRPMTVLRRWHRVWGLRGRPVTVLRQRKRLPMSVLAACSAFATAPCRKSVASRHTSFPNPMTPSQKRRKPPYEFPEAASTVAKPSQDALGTRGLSGLVAKPSQAAIGAGGFSGLPGRSLCRRRRSSPAHSPSSAWRSGAISRYAAPSCPR